ncbi:unnamed protein product [Withania somnifera]
MSNWISCYYPSTNSWNTHVTSIPSLLENHILKDFAMIVIGEDIYVIGGRQCYKDVQEIDIEVLPCVLKYNVGTNCWTKCAPLKTSRFNFACMVSKDGKIYVAGGQTTFDGAKGTSLAEVYDPVLDEWKQLPNMSTTRYKCAGLSWQGKFYVVGGFAKRENTDINQLGPYTMERSSAEVYDPERDTWNYMARMWDLDVPPYQIVNVDGKLYSSGDCLNTWKGHIESYDGKHNLWYIVDGSTSPISTLEIDNQNIWPNLERMFCTMAPIGTKLYFFAGYRIMLEDDISRIRTEVHVFETASGGNGWSSLIEPIKEEGEKELSSHSCVMKLKS